MLIALSAWNGRIAPLFDAAHQLRLLRMESGRVVAEWDEPVSGLSAAEKAGRLAERGVGLLVCGAISHPARLLVEAYGVRILAFVAGEQSDVVRALTTGRLAGERGAAPGRRAGRQRGWRAHESDAEWRVTMAEEPPSRGDREPAGGGPCGRRKGRGPAPEGRRKGPGGTCVCPSCGHEEPHQQGVPCTRSRCPECGSALVRH